MNDRRCVVEEGSAAHKYSGPSRVPALHMVFVGIGTEEHHATDTACGAVALRMVQVPGVMIGVVDPVAANIAFDMVFFSVEGSVVE